MPTDPRLAALITLFGERAGRRLARASFVELLEAADDPAHRLNAYLEPSQRPTLLALMRLCQLYYPEPAVTRPFIACTADAVRYLSARCRNGRERVVWLLALDDYGALLAEVLVVYGGDSGRPPPVRSLLRHAIAKDASTAVVVDYRPQDPLPVDDAAQDCANLLRRFGRQIGIHLLDYVLVGPGGARSVDGWHSADPFSEAA